MTALDVTTEHDGDTVRVSLRGELDIASAPSVERALAHAEAGGSSCLVLNLRELAFMDSTGLRIVLRADTRARENGRRVVIVRGSDVVSRLFEVTGLDERLTIIDEPADA